MSITIPEPTVAPSASDAKLDAVLEGIAALTRAMSTQTASSAPAPAPATSPSYYSGPAGAAAMSAPLQPPPPPEPAKVGPTPYPGENFAPGDMGFYVYHDHRDREGVDRVQVVSVAYVDGEHVHAIVLGPANDLASFAHGQLTHAYPGRS